MSQVASPHLFMRVRFGVLAFWSFHYMLFSPNSLADRICLHRNLGWQDFSNAPYLRKEGGLRMTSWTSVVYTRACSSVERMLWESHQVLLHSILQEGVELCDVETQMWA